MITEDYIGPNNLFLSLDIFKKNNLREYDKPNNDIMIVRYDNNSICAFDMYHNYSVIYDNTSDERYRKCKLDGKTFLYICLHRFIISHYFKQKGHNALNSYIYIDRLNDKMITSIYIDKDAAIVMPWDIDNLRVDALYNFIWYNDVWYRLYKYCKILPNPKL